MRLSQICAMLGVHLANAAVDILISHRPFTSDIELGKEDWVGDFKNLAA